MVFVCFCYLAFQVSKELDVGDTAAGEFPKLEQVLVGKNGFFTNGNAYRISGINCLHASYKTVR